MRFVRPLADVRLLAGLIGAVPFVLHAWVALQGFYGQDDFLIMYRAGRSQPGDLGFLLQNYNGHLSPGMFLLAWLATAISPLNFALLMGPLLIMQAVALVLLWRLLVELFGARPVLLVPFAVYAFSPIVLFSSLWWAYGVTLIPLLLTMFGALLAHLRYLRTGAVRQAVFAILWTAAGLAFYEKAVLFVGLMFGVTVLMAPASERGPVRRAIRRHWRLWSAYLALALAYAAAYVGLTGGTARNSTTFALIPALARRMILDTLLVPTFGIPVRGWITGSADLLPPSEAVQLLVGVAAIAVVFAGVVVGGRRGIHAWVLFAGYLVMDVALVAVARLSLLGALVGTDCRYIADAVPVAVLCATFAFLPARQAEPASEPEPAPATAPEPVPDRRLPLRAVAVVLTLLMMVGTTVSFLRLAPSFRFAEARDYVRTARAELAKAPGIPLYDGPVPDELMISWFGVEARTSRVVSLLPDPPRFDRPAETLYQLDRSGTPRVIQRMVNTVAAAPPPAGACGYAITQRPTMVPLVSGVLGKRLVRLDYFTADTGDGWVSLAGSSVPVTFERGAHVLYVPVSGLFGGLEIRRASALAPVCIGNVLVGEPIV